LNQEVFKQQWVDSRNLIKTDSKYFNAVVNKELTDSTIQAYFSAKENNSFDVYMAPGFIASDKDGNTTTLGRGGSDYTGAIYAAALKASALEIWTDVSGNDDRRSKNGEQCQRDSTNFLSRSHGIVSFWCKDYLSSNHSAGNVSKYTSMD